MWYWNNRQVTEWRCIENQEIDSHKYAPPPPHFDTGVKAGRQK